MALYSLPLMKVVHFIRNTKLLHNVYTFALHFWAIRISSACEKSDEINLGYPIAWLGCLFRLGSLYLDPRFWRQYFDHRLQFRCRTILLWQTLFQWTRWVEVLAQQQGLVFNPGENTDSYFGNTSSSLVTQVNAYHPPADASNALVVIWVNNADLYYPALDPLPTMDKFTSVINAALANQFKAITNLYAKGIRTLVMPNVVDISTIPKFNGYILYKSLFRQASISYNTSFMVMLDKARAACPGLTIVVPDYFSLLNNLLAHPTDYALLNALYNLLNIDALFNPLLLDKSLNGPGANYIFWDPTDPTAKVHFIMASIAQQLVSPARINGLAQVNGSNRLDLVNLPVGMNGFLDGSTNLASGWTTVTNFNSSTTTASIFVVTPPLPANFGAGPGDLAVLVVLRHREQERERRQLRTQMLLRMSISTCRSIACGFRIIGCGPDRASLLGAISA